MIIMVIIIKIIITKVIHKKLVEAAELNEDKSPYYKYTPASVLEIDNFNPLNPELNPICYLLALLGAHHFLHFSAG